MSTASGTPSSKPDRIGVVEAIRGVAVLAVAWFHFTNANPVFPTDSWLRASGTYGWLGVESFFVVSGFVLPLAMWRTRYRWRDAVLFLARRVVRLEPPYLVAVAVTLALWWVSSQSSGFDRRPPDAVQILLHVAYLPPFFGYDWLNAAYWTLAIEMQFYILLALSFPLLAHESGSIRVAWLIAAAGLSLVLPSEMLVFRYLSVFALGAATFLVSASLLDRRAYGVAVIGLAAVSVVSDSMAVALVGVGTALAIATVRHVPPWLLWLPGTTSYSMYLLHGPIGGRVVNLGSRYAESPLGQLGVVLAAVAVSLIAAFVLYRLVERPALQWAASMRRRAP